MAKLATQLQGRMTYDEFQNNTDIRQPEKALILAIFAEAAIDVAYDLQSGNDLEDPCRVIGESGKRCVMPPKKIATGRPQEYYLSGYSYFMDNSLEEWSFLWCCQALEQDWQGYARTLRKKILRLVKESC
jgi:hypothetical protein